MSDQNPYMAPEAQLETVQQGDYQPSIFTFRGRIGRLRYLAYGSGTTLILVGLYVVTVAIVGAAGAFGAISPETGLPIILIIIMSAFYIATIFFSIMFGKRRLNDLNRSGWWILLFIIPFLNLLLAIYLIFFSGTKKHNNYGPPPVQNSLGVKILGLFLPLSFLVLAGVFAAIAIPQYQNYMDQAEKAQVK
jgi:uncharacterized membrane protein YhaH (DUF805 family)